MFAITFFFVVGYFDPNFHVTLTKADNFPIILMIYSMFITIWWSMYQAYLNDERLENGLKPNEYNDPDDKVLVWPDLVYIEFIALILFMVFLIVWSILVAAPLEEPANPAATPNPSKAPWYFLGLQEMLVYFDPWIAGIVFPMFIIIGMMAIPYMDINKKGDGYYSFKERRIGMFIFMYGWLVLWLFLIVIGTFFRGPNWNFFGPFEYWDAHKVVPLNNVNLSEYIWVKTLGTGLPANILIREGIGFLVLVAYMGILPILLAKSWLKNYFQEIGPVRYTFIMLFGLSMLALPIKMYMRWLFNLKYIIAIPEWFFNI
ncbi:MAG: cytochrome C [Candidatus Marinimicrobia bacterium]|nr:cytochrome C [Candidatus Neomarinimicrobiota bacterium]